MCSQLEHTQLRGGNARAACVQEVGRAGNSNWGKVSAERRNVAHTLPRRRLARPCPGGDAPIRGGAGRHRQGASEGCGCRRLPSPCSRPGLVPSPARDYRTAVGSTDSDSLRSPPCAALRRPQQGQRTHTPLAGPAATLQCFAVPQPPTQAPGAPDYPGIRADWVGRALRAPRAPRRWAIVPRGVHPAVQCLTSRVLSPPTPHMPRDIGAVHFGKRPTANLLNVPRLQ